jgi:hypothetical protein
MTAPHRNNRHKRRTALVGSIALLAVLGAGAATVNQAFADTPGGTSDQSSSTAGTLSGDTVPITTRSLTAALQAAVGDVADGTASDFDGHLAYASSSKTYDPLVDDAERDGYSGTFTFTPADGSGGALVHAVIADKGGMDYNQTTAEENFTTCTSVQEECKVTTLPDGSLLKTYVLYGIGGGDERGHEMLMAERMVGDAVVRVSATNGGALTEAGNEITRPHAVLSIEQLTEIVSQPWWGYDLPAEFADAELPGYHESDSIID